LPHPVDQTFFAQQFTFLTKISFLLFFTGQSTPLIKPFSRVFFLIFVFVGF